MPGCAPQAFTIVLYNVQLHANGGVIGLDVAIAGRRAALRGNGVEIIVDTCLGAANVHVKVNGTTKQIP